MLHHIEHLRSKPEHIRKRIAFLTSLGITLVIFVFWIVSMSVPSSLEVASNTKKSNSPSSFLTANVSGFWGYIKGFFVGSNQNTYSSSGLEVTAGKR